MARGDTKPPLPRHFSEEDYEPEESATLIRPPVYVPRTRGPTDVERQILHELRARIANPQPLGREWANECRATTPTGMAMAKAVAEGRRS